MEETCSPYFSCKQLILLQSTFRETTREKRKTYSLQPHDSGESSSLIGDSRSKMADESVEGKMADESKVEEEIIDTVPFYKLFACRSERYLADSYWLLTVLLGLLAVDSSPWRFD